MADKNTRTNTLGIELEESDTASSDGKIQKMTLKLPNPKNNLTEQYIKENLVGLLTLILFPTGEPIDPTQQSRFSINGAYTEIVEKIELDIGIEST